jgi:hypothetical protein
MSYWSSVVEGSMPMPRGPRRFLRQIIATLAENELPRVSWVRCGSSPLRVSFLEDRGMHAGWIECRITNIEYRMPNKEEPRTDMDSQEVMNSLNSSLKKEA